MYTSALREQEPYGLLGTYNSGLDDPDPVFMYHEHDHIMRGIPLINAFNSDSWDALRSNSNSRLLISYIGDYFNTSDLVNFRLALKAQRVSHDRVWFICMDRNYADLALRELPGIHVGVYNHLLNLVKDPQNQYDPEYRFSVLSRNYRPWRLDLYLNLARRKLLERALYSFHDFNPYNNLKPNYSIEEIGRDALSLGHDLNIPEIKNFLLGIPYDLPLSHRKDKWSPITTASIVNAGIHILIESHYHVFEHWSHYKNMDPRQFVPGFFTEKTYKAVACRRPFIAVSTPYFLEDLVKLGYKSFAPYINESYDSIEDDKARMLAITAEVKRLNSLNDQEFADLLTYLKPICDHNYDVFRKQQDSNTWPDWAWLKEFV